MNDEQRKAFEGWMREHRQRAGITSSDETPEVAAEVAVAVARDPMVEGCEIRRISDDVARVTLRWVAPDEMHRKVVEGEALRRARDAQKAVEAEPEPEPGWESVCADTAYAPPFGTIRMCRVCGCLVAGGPTVCVRCAEGAITHGSLAAAEELAERERVELRGAPAIVGKYGMTACDRIAESIALDGIRPLATEGAVTGWCSECRATRRIVRGECVECVAAPDDATEAPDASESVSERPVSEEQQPADPLPQEQQWVTFSATFAEAIAEAVRIVPGQEDALSVYTRELNAAARRDMMVIVRHAHRIDAWAERHGRAPLAEECLDILRRGLDVDAEVRAAAEKAGGAP